MSIPRVAWKDLPREVRSAVEKRTGRVLDASDVPTGANSGIAVRLLTETDALFVKGVPVDHPQVSTQVREALINPHLPASAPRLRWHAETAGWDLLAFEMIDGRTADFSPGSRDLPLVVGALLELALAHCPAQPLRTMPEGKAHLVDWAWPTRGAAWIDPAVWIIRLIDAGNPPNKAEDWAARLPSWSHAPSAAVTAFARASVALWEGVALYSPDQAWQKGMAAAARRWAGYRIARSDWAGHRGSDLC